MLQQPSLYADLDDTASLTAIESALAAAAPNGSCVVIGNFDGVHLGHQALFAAAKTQDLPVVALTFSPHPRELFGLPHARLLTSADRVSLLHEVGADLVIMLRFTPELAAMSPEDFADQLLVRTLRTRVLVLGHDFVLGKGRAGTAERLGGIGESRNFVVRRIPALLDADGVIISSTRIREFLAAAAVDKAALQLGRPHHLTGTVVQGFQRGRQLGFPTANLALPEPAPLMPAPGVYASSVVLENDDKFLPSVTNIGRNPTFANEAQTIETHLLDFSGDLYGQTLTVRFHHHLRSERKFESLDALKAQLFADTEQARALL